MSAFARDLKLGEDVLVGGNDRSTRAHKYGKNFIQREQRMCELRNNETYHKQTKSRNHGPRCSQVASRHSDSVGIVARATCAEGHGDRLARRADRAHVALVAKSGRMGVAAAGGRGNGGEARASAVAQADAINTSPVIRVVNAAIGTYAHASITTHVIIEMLQ